MQHPLTPNLWPNSSILVLVLALPCAPTALAQPTRPATRPAGRVAPAGEEQIRAALRELIPLYEQAVSSDNIDPDTDKLDTLKPYLAVDFSAVMVTSREVHNFEELRQFWKDMKSNYIGKGGKYRVKVNYEPSVIVNNVVIAKGTADEYVQSDKGNEFKYQSEWTAVFRRNPTPGADPATQWQIVRLHSSMDPVFNPFVSLSVRLYRWLMIIFAVLLAIVIGLVAFWMFRQRRARNAPAAN